MPDIEPDGHAELMGTERMKDALDLLDRFPQLTWEDLLAIITVGVANQKEKRILFRGVENAREMGHRSPSTVHGLENRLRSDIADSFQYVEKTGGLTAVSSMVFDRMRGDTTWKILEDGPHILAANFKEGQFGWITGLPGTGKTATALKILEEWIDLGHVALSNIRIKGDIEDYHYVGSPREMFLRIADIIEQDPDYWLMVLDDAGASGLSTDYASTSRVKDLNRLAKLAVRKLGGNLILVDQREAKGGVPTIIQEFSSSRFYCHRVGGGIVTVDLRGPYRYFHMKIEDFPMTPFEFSTKGAAYFDMTDLDLDALFSALHDDQPDQYPQVIRKSLAK